MSGSSKLLTLLRRRDTGFKASDVTDVPEAEAQKLIDLYNATDGANWTDNTGWLSDPVADNWYGITVASGHVTTIALNANGATMSGSVATWGNDLDTTLPSLLSLYLYSTSVSGDISGWTLPALLQNLRLYSTSVSGDLSSWTLPASLLNLSLDATSVSGDISGWTLPASLQNLRLNPTSVSGDISSWTLPASLQYLYINSTSFSNVPLLGTATSLRKADYDDLSLSQAEVDAVLLDMYTNWATFTYATPALDIGGTGGTINAAPSGTYQDGDPPTTGLEYVYELANDPETTGNETWTIVYNGGSAP